MADLGPLREWGAKSRLMMDPSFTNLLGGAAVGNPNLQRRPPILPTQMLPQPAMPQAPSVLREPLPMEGRLSFLPAMVTPERGREWALPGVLASAVNAFTAPGRALRGDPVGPDEAMNFAGNVILGGMPAAPTGFGLSGITAWHGSPHKFAPHPENPLGKFDPSKIGTGEGAQAYGVGAAYLAENRSVAEGYKRILGNREFQLGDKSIYASTGGASRVLDNQPRAATIAADFLDSAFDAQSAAPAAYASNRLRQHAKQYPDDAKLVDEAMNYIADWQAHGSVAPKQGYIYKTDLPDEQVAKMLDWDKPLSQQSVNSDAIVSYINKRAKEQGRGRLATPDITGEKAHRLLSSFLNSEQRVTEKLIEFGIPGIRYLDQGSRNAGGWRITPPSQTVSGKWMVKSSDYNSKGMHFDTEAQAQAALKEKTGSETRNFVVFDENIPKILGRE